MQEGRDDSGWDLPTSHSFSKQSNRLNQNSLITHLLGHAWREMRSEERTRLRWRVALRLRNLHLSEALDSQRQGVCFAR